MKGIGMGHKPTLQGALLVPSLQPHAPHSRTFGWFWVLPLPTHSCFGHHLPQSTSTEQRGETALFPLPFSFKTLITLVCEGKPAMCCNPSFFFFVYTVRHPFLPTPALQPHLLRWHKEQSTPKSKGCIYMDKKSPLNCSHPRQEMFQRRSWQP